MKNYIKALIAASITLALIIYYRWHYLKVTVQYGLFIVKYKAGFRSGTVNIYLFKGDYSAITLPNGYRIVPINFDDSWIIELHDPNYHVLEYAEIDSSGNVTIHNDFKKV